MLEDFHLGAITRQGDLFRVRRIPLLQQVQNDLAEEWSNQFDALGERTEEVKLDLGYSLDPDQIFAIDDFILPPWLIQPATVEFPDIARLSTDIKSLLTIKGTVAFASHQQYGSVLLFQNFTRTKVIRPRTFLILERDTFSSPGSAALALDSKLSAVYLAQENELKFLDFRSVNTFLPLDDVLREATSGEIRELLLHPKLKTENLDRWANERNQWFKKRFSMLRESSVLDDYSVEFLRDKGATLEVDVQLSDDKIIFPSDAKSGKRLLQLLVEDLFLGALSGDLYETNSKRRPT